MIQLTDQTNYFIFFQWCRFRVAISPLLLCNRTDDDL